MSIEVVSPTPETSDVAKRREYPVQQQFWDPKGTLILLTTLLVFVKKCKVVVLIIN